MIRSMTGYGDAEGDSPAGRIRVEVKSVNHRFFNANIRTPSGFDRFEKAITDALKALDGASRVTPDLERRTIAIQTSARLTDVETALAAAGYPITPR